MYNPVLRVFFLFLIMVLFGGASALTSDIQKPHIIYFYSDDCEHCKEVHDDFLPGFLASYGDSIVFTEIEVSSRAAKDSLYALESRVDFPEKDKEYPAVYFMGTMIEGPGQVVMRLEHMVKAVLANPDSAEAVHREVIARTPEKYDPAAIQAAKTVHMIYFFERGCKVCGRAEEIADWLESLYDTKITRLNIDEDDNKVIAVALGQRTGVPEKKLMSTPVFFVGDDFLLSEDISRNRLVALIKNYAKTGAPAFWETLGEQELKRAKEHIREQFSSFAIFAVALAGLGDGINPCAFATILFFVSYLTMVGRKRNEILAVGLSFAVSVFTTYFLVGLGVFAFIESLANIEFLAKIIFGVTAGMCFVFGFFSIGDYFKARAGKTSDMALQLPAFLKKRIHATIREKARMEGIVAGALAAGFLVSILELACTGQVYLPTIIFMVGVEGYTAKAVGYLLLYNICFILPLLAVFGVVYFGVSSHTVGKIMESRVATVKLILAAVFFVVGGLMIWAVFL